MEILILIGIILLEMYSRHTTRFFKGFIMRNKNGRFVPAIKEAHDQSPEMFWKLARPFLILSFVELSLIVLLIVEIVK